MPYMVSFMRKHSASPEVSYGDFIIVQSAWGITQGIVLPIGGALVGIIGEKCAVLLGSALFALGPFLSAFVLTSR